MKEIAITTGNVSIAVNLFGAQIQEDNGRTYLKGKAIQDLFFQTYMRDEMLTFHKDWNMLIEACKIFTDFKKMFQMFESKLVGEYGEYCMHVKCINHYLCNYQKQELFNKLVSACDWLMNLKEKKTLLTESNYYNR